MIQSKSRGERERETDLKVVVGTRRRRQEQNLSFVEEDPSTGPCRFFGVNRNVGPLVMERRSIQVGKSM